ncbi:MAG: prepilin-type N-terminal cleavage/methylation domain-containing protein [Defluviitaleaceae bacterium]|nr:prepilin-type N-terminal cleavage/methylation domain-containing protein [Defluviitaleaceae bacterium]
MVKNEKGFTLIEALISLVILSIVSLMSFTFILNLHDYIRLNQVLSVFQADLHHARDFNMMQLNGSERMVIRIYHDENRYVILVGDVVKSQREFPSHVSVLHQNTISNISFNERGNLGQGRTFIFSSRYHERSVVFSVGAGGFDVR